MGMRVWYGKGEKESRARSLLSPRNTKSAGEPFPPTFICASSTRKQVKKESGAAIFERILDLLRVQERHRICIFSAAGKSAEETVELLCAFLNRPVGTTALAQLLPWDSTRPKMYTPQPVWNCISGLGWLPMSFWASALWIVESIVTSRDPPSPFKPKKLVIWCVEERRIWYYWCLIHD